jgi:hypothetical protein
MPLCEFVPAGEAVCGAEGILGARFLANVTISGRKKTAAVAVKSVKKKRKGFISALKQY